jgi:hypothetical protein
MIALTMSNGEHLTHEDLEKYLSEYELFYRKKIDEGILEYEWNDLVKFHNNEIEKSLRKFDKIELIVWNIGRMNYFNPQLLGLNTKIGEQRIHLRGEEIGPQWKFMTTNNYETGKIIPIYETIFEEIKLNSSILPKSKEYKKFLYLYKKILVPNVNFKKISSELPKEPIRKGDRIMFNLNLLEIKYPAGEDESKKRILYIDYLEKVNVFPQINDTEYDSSGGNSNCFIVTATMGDVNHPVVNDFRMFRDNVLLETFLGRLFISIYYKIGPYLANLIKSNHFLLNTSRNLVLFLHRKIK